MVDTFKGVTFERIENMYEAKEFGGELSSSAEILRSIWETLV